ncbi:MAG: hypothetical protein K2X87_05140 [Gemmataceae bacterium]|nr:hypothetical protein [Gemmataceae bacterium]
MFGRGLTLALALSLAAVAPSAARAAITTDPAGDFLATFTGPHNGDLDVTGVEVLFDGSVFTLHAVVDAPVGTTAGGFYVWGVNRGAGTAGFGASLGLDGVLFDRVVILRSDGTGTVPGVGDLAPGSVTIVGNEIFGEVPLALLPSTGFAPLEYTWNLWPRAPGIAGVAGISDFAPDNSNIPVSTPAPAAIWLAVSGVLALPVFARLRRPRTVG